MKLKTLGNTGLYVSEISLGSMAFGSDGFWKEFGSLSLRDAEAMVGFAFDHGVNVIDTADAYSSGESETIVGRVIKKLSIPRDQLVIATKGLAQLGKGPNSGGMSRYHLLAAIKNSLKRLDMDHVDLYQLHGFDPATPIEEAMRALDQMVRDGLVRYVGLSNWSAWQIMKAIGISERLGLARVEAVQAYYNVATRDIERELVPLMRSEKLGLLVWSPLAGGFLSGKYERDGSAPDGARRKNFDFPPVHQDRAHACVEVMRRHAFARGVSISQIALSWLLHQPVVSTVIVGARTLDQLKDSLSATEIRLSEEELQELSLVAPPPSEYPGWMLDLIGQTRSNPHRFERTSSGGGASNHS